MQETVVPRAAWGLGGLLALSLALSACGGGGDDDNAPPVGGGGGAGGGGTPATDVTVAGSVAVGAPVAGATVTVKCAAATAVTTVTTDTEGAYTVQIPDNAFPCALQASGGDLPEAFTALHSLAATAEATIVNITPLTDLALSRAAGIGAGSWFASPVGWPSAAEALPAAFDTLRTLLLTQGFGVPASWPAGSLAPLDLAFVPSRTPAPDTIDSLLEQVQAAAAAANTSFDTLVAGFLQATPTLPPRAQAGGGQAGGGGAGAQAAVGRAAIGAYTASSTADGFLAAVGGSWPVAIHKVPDAQPGWYGNGTLTVSGDERSWTMELRGADGSTIFRRSNDGALLLQVMPFIGQLFISHGTGVGDYLSVFVTPDGFIEGSAGGEMQVQFRNEVLAYGAAVPALFGRLAGTWQSTEMVSTSGSPFGPFATVTNTVTIDAQGRVTVSGTTQLGAEVSTTVAWGQLDDFLIPDPENDSIALLLDIRTPAGVSAGRVRLLFSELDGPTLTDIDAFVDVDGQEQLLELNAPVRAPGD